MLEWTFSPVDFFEVAINIRRDDYTMAIADGKVRADILGTVFDTNPEMRETLRKVLESRFLAVQLVSRKPYDLSEPTMTRVHPDGRKEYHLNVSGVIHMHSASTLDVRVIDEYGNVTADTKRDRINKKEMFAELVAKHRPNDQSLDSMLRSFDTAIRDPRTELTHLYEIRDAVTTHYGNENKARSALAIGKKDWSDFGRICNDEPLRQGRHRGNNVGALRDATHTELELARNIGLAMIEAHLNCLDQASSLVEQI